MEMFSSWETSTSKFLHSHLRIQHHSSYKSILKCSEFFVTPKKKNCLCINIGAKEHSPQSSRHNSDGPHIWFTDHNTDAHPCSTIHIRPFTGTVCLWLIPKGTQNSTSLHNRARWRIYLKRTSIQARSVPAREHRQRWKLNVCSASPSDGLWPWWVEVLFGFQCLPSPVSFFLPLSPV